MKMQCAECKNIVYVGKVAGWRAGRTNSRCMACGSLRLEEYVKPAKPTQGATSAGNQTQETEVAQ